MALLHTISSNVATVRHIFFDAANTLINKPLLWEKIASVFERHHYVVPAELLRQRHKLVSEWIRFPDRTSKEFYSIFNAELMFSLGIVPNDVLLSDLFAECTYLPWKKFSDTDVLSVLKGSYPLSILSNFNNDLRHVIEKEFGSLFTHIIGSEAQRVAKPNPEFFRLAMIHSGLKSEEILFVGDSLKLDIQPAEAAGMNALLIDRENIYPLYPKRILSLRELEHYLSDAGPSRNAAH